MFASSKVRILSDENSTEPCSVLMDELSFFNSSWQLFSVNLTIRNCHIAFSSARCKIFNKCQSGE